jgi:hypothetical protein
VVFGKVIEGMDVVRKMEATEVAGEGHRPTEPVIVSGCGELELIVPPRLRAHLEAQARRKEGGDGTGSGKKKRRKE